MKVCGTRTPFGHASRRFPIEIILSFWQTTLRAATMQARDMSKRGFIRM